MRWVTTVVLVAVLAALGLYIVFNKESLSSDAVLKSREKRVFSSLKPSDVTRLEVTNTKDKFVFEKGSELSWKMTSPRAGEADPGAIDAILSGLEFLEPRRVFDAAEAGFELDKPRATVVAEGGGQKVSIAIGASDAGADGVYARATDGDSTKVVRIEKSLFEAVDKDTAAFRNRKLATLSSWQIEKFTIESPGGGRIFAEKEGGNWLFKEPFVARGDSEKIRELHNAILAMAIVDFANDAPAAADLATYGLDAPRYVITLEGAPKEIGAADAAKANRPIEKISIGGEAPNDAVYAMKSGAGAVTVSDDVLSKLKADFDTLRDHRLFSRPGEALSRFEIVPRAGEGGGKKTVLVAKKKKDDAGDEDAFAVAEPEWKLEEPVAAPADRDAVAEFARKWKELRATSFAPRGKDLADYGLAEPALSITGTLETGGEKWTLLVGSATEDGASRYAKTAAEDHVYVVPKADVEALEPAWHAFRDKKLTDFLAADAKSVTVTSDGATHEFVQKGADAATRKWARKTSDGSDAEIDRTEMTSFLAKFTMLRADSFATDDLSKAPDLKLGPDALSIAVAYTKEIEEESEGADPATEKPEKTKVDETRVIRVASEAGEGGKFAAIVDGVDLVAWIGADLAAAARTLLEKTGAVTPPPKPADGAETPKPGDGADSKAGAPAGEPKPGDGGGDEKKPEEKPDGAAAPAGGGA